MCCRCGPLLTGPAASGGGADPALLGADRIAGGVRLGGDSLGVGVGAPGDKEAGGAAVPTFFGVGGVPGADCTAGAVRPEFDPDDMGAETPGAAAGAGGIPADVAAGVAEPLAGPGGTVAVPGALAGPVIGLEDGGFGESCGTGVPFGVSNGVVAVTGFGAPDGVFGVVAAFCATDGGRATFRAAAVTPAAAAPAPICPAVNPPTFGRVAGPGPTTGDPAGGGPPAGSPAGTGPPGRGGPPAGPAAPGTGEATAGGAPGAVLTEVTLVMFVTLFTIVVLWMLANTTLFGGGAT